MKRAYDDLLSLTGRKPSFFQAEGVPRWADFQPGDSTSPYAVDCAIVEIACQLCDMRFHVLMESTSRDRTTVEEQIRTSTLAYRDPPNVGCCPGGPSTTSETVRVIEYWRRQRTFTWERDGTLETAFRRVGDPWTPDMRRKADEMLADPSTEEDMRSSIRESIEAADARAETVAEDQPLQYASEFRTAA